MVSPNEAAGGRFSVFSKESMHHSLCGMVRLVALCVALLSAIVTLLLSPLLLGWNGGAAFTGIVYARPDDASLPGDALGALENAYNAYEEKNDPESGGTENAPAGGESGAAPGDRGLLIDNGAGSDGVTIICLDAGHGYDDPGAESPWLNGLYEKDINLDITLRTAALLRAEGYTVLLTRENDDIPASHNPYTDGMYLMNPYDRADFVREAKMVDLFVSIHCNALPEHPEMSGTELYYFEGYGACTESFAWTMYDAFKALLPDRPVRILGRDYENAYYVTKETGVPSLLVETGYITHRGDAALLLDERFRDTLARAIADGIIAQTGLDEETRPAA